MSEEFEKEQKSLDREETGHSNPEADSHMKDEGQSEVHKEENRMDSENNQSSVYRFNQRELNHQNGYNYDYQRNNQSTYRQDNQSYYGQNNQSSYGQNNQNAYQQANYGGQGYQQNYNNQSGYSQANQGYQQNYMNYQNAQKPKKPKRKSNGTGKKWMKLIAAALVFGIIAGGTMEGIHAIGRAVRKDNPEQNQINIVKTSSKNVETAEYQDVSDIAEQALPSIVAVNTKIQVTSQDFFGRKYTQEGQGAGSGIIFSQDADNIYVMTNYHVIQDSTEIQVTFNDTTTADAKIEGFTENPDIAVLSVPLSSLSDDTKNHIKAAVIGDSDTLKMGEGAIAIGNALGYGQSVVTGTVSALNRQIQLTDETTTVIQTSAAINPGNSGGALLNTKGEVIGVNTAKYSDTKVEGVGWAIPINKAIETANGILSGDIVTKTDENTAALGIKGGTISEEISSQYGYPQGVLISTVYDNSAASRAGLTAGCIITGFNDKEIKTMEALQAELQNCNPGDTVKMKVCVPKDSRHYSKPQEVVTVLGSKADMTQE